MKKLVLGGLGPSLLLLASCAGQPVQPTIPAALVPPGEQAVERLSARGVQIYQCRALAQGPSWAFVAPEAALFDDQGRDAGKHFAGPHWEAPDASRIVGTVKSRADAPQGGAIPWLLLSTRSVGGQGRFAAVTSVQRVNTEGGLAPARPCDAGALGATERVPYTADYVFLSGRAVASR